MSRNSLVVARDTPTLRELTTAKLRDAILSLRFKPDQHLVERELCAETGVSRTSVREALRQLEAEGLVERRGNRGLFVSSLTMQEAQQVYEVRAALEPEMARLFAERAGARELKALASAFRWIQNSRSGNYRRVDGQKFRLRAFRTAADTAARGFAFDL